MSKRNSSLRDSVPLLVVAAACIACLGALNLFRTPVAADAKTTAAGVTGAGTHSDATAHNPNVQSFGNGHLEAQMLKDGTLRVFVLDQTAKAASPILEPTLEAEVQPPGEDPAPVTLEGKPLPGETDGYCSRFIGQVPPQLRSRQSEVGLTVTVVEGRPGHGSGSYRLHFAPEALNPGAFAAGGRLVDVAMPDAPQGDEESKLFLTPGGAYTAADIAANGNMTAARKYAGMMAQHSMTSVKGDHVCPITNTRADRRFAWVVGSKRYLFCCAPCVAEFVKRAKEDPKPLLDPDTYLKR